MLLPNSSPRLSWSCSDHFVIITPTETGLVEVCIVLHLLNPEGSDLVGALESVDHPSFLKHPGNTSGIPCAAGGSSLSPAGLRLVLFVFGWFFISLIW